MNNTHYKNTISAEQVIPSRDDRSIAYKGETLSVPDAFWDGKTQSPNVGALVKSHADLRRKLSEQGSGGATLSADRDAVPDMYELCLPKGMEDHIQVAPEDPLAKNAMDWARRHGLGQEAFSELTQMYYERLASEQQDDDHRQEGELEKLHEALGPRADHEMEDLSRWVDGLLGPDLENAPELYCALDQLTSSADGVILLRTLKERLGERGVPTSRMSSGPYLNEESLRQLQSSEAYRSGDKSTRRQVAEGWARLYPDQKPL